MSAQEDLYMLHPFYEGYVADGFHSDCGMLIQRCLQCDKLNFEIFCKMWKEMNFDCLYQGRLSGAEIAELSEELIHIGKQYMLAETNNFEETVAGLFIVYALLNLQPYSGFAALRVVPQDVARINHIEMVARRERRLDVLYILGSVLIKGPCQYHAAEREYGMEHSYKKYLQGYSDVDKMGVRCKGVFYSNPEELSVLRDLAGITSRYVQAKEAIAGSSVAGNKKADLSLRFINKNLAKELDESLRNVITGISDEDRQVGASATTSSSPQEIKERAMKGAVGKMRHLVGVSNRPTKTLKKEKGSYESENISNADFTPTPSTSNCKRKASTSRSPNKFRRKHNNDNDRFVSSPDLSDDDLNLDDFHQTPKTTEKSTRKATADQEIEIEIESIPIYIRTDEGESIEIEIVDHYKDDQKNYGDSKKGIITAECSKASGTDEQKVMEAFSADDDRQSFIKRPAKRDQIKHHVKSKFKRMGMLPVANFKEVEIEKKD